MKDYQEIYDETNGDTAKMLEAMELELKMNQVPLNIMHLVSAEIAGLKYGMKVLADTLIEVGVAADVLPDGLEQSAAELDAALEFCMQRGIYDVSFMTWQQTMQPESKLVVAQAVPGGGAGLEG